MLRLDGPVDAPEGQPLGDHQEGQGIKGDVRAGEEGDQPAYGNEDRFDGQDEDVRGPLFLKEEREPGADLASSA